MLRLVGQRLVLGFMTLLIVSVLIFAVTEWRPDDLASDVLGKSATPEAIAKVRAELALDRPVQDRYVAWLQRAISGDLGRSLTTRRPVIDVIGPRIANTLFLAVYAAAIAIPLSILLGILAAFGRNGLFDRLARIVALAAVSMPEFLIGMCLVLYLSVQFKWFPSIATYKPNQMPVQHLHTLFLPMLTLALVMIAHMVRMTRAAVLAAMAHPYIETAVLKGLRPWRIVTRHALPNALPGIIDAVALCLAYLLAGVVVVEAVFSYNGLGGLIVDAVARRDVPVVQASGLVFAIMFIGLNLIADVLSIVSNPRLRQSR